MSDKTPGQAAYEKFHEVFHQTGFQNLVGKKILSWDELGSPKEQPARVQEKWEAIAQAAIEQQVKLFR